MGTICIQNQNAKTYENRSQNQEGQQLQLSKIKIISKELNRINTQCLILFVDNVSNVLKNEFLINSSTPNLDQKIQQYINIELNGNKLNVGEFLFINHVEIQKFNCKSVVVVCIDMWKGGTLNMKHELLESLVKVFKQINQKNIKKICITDFNSKFGIPSQIRKSLIPKAISQSQAVFNDIVVICLTQDAQNLLMEGLDIVKSQQTSQSRQISIRSDYY